jgi:hypothetical protein
VTNRECGVNDVKSFSEIYQPELVGLHTSSPKSVSIEQVLMYSRPYLTKHLCTDDGSDMPIQRVCPRHICIRNPSGKFIDRCLIEPIFRAEVVYAEDLAGRLYEADTRIAANRQDNGCCKPIFAVL